MKCLMCKCEFEPSAEEHRMLVAGAVRSHDIPYCSLACAQADAVNTRHYKGKIPRNLYHVGTRGEVPTFGVWAEEIVDASRHGDGHEGKFVRLRKNVGGSVPLVPYTVEMRLQTAKLRGRATFSEGCTVLVLPSSRFYNSRTNKSHLANSSHK